MDLDGCPSLCNPCAPNKVGYFANNVDEILERGARGSDIQTVSLDFVLEEVSSDLSMMPIRVACGYFALLDLLQN